MSLLDEHWAEVVQAAFSNVPDPAAPHSVLEAIEGASPESLASLSRPHAVVTAMKLASTLSALRESLGARLESLLAAADVGEDAESEIAGDAGGLDNIQQQLDQFASRLEQAAERRARNQERLDELKSLEQQVQAAEAELERLKTIEAKEQEWIDHRAELQEQVKALEARVEREVAPSADLKRQVRQESDHFIRLSQDALSRLDEETAAALRNASGLDERLEAARARWARIEEEVPDVLKKIEALKLYEQADSEVAGGAGGNALETVEPLLEEARELLKKADDSLKALLKGKEAVAQVRLPFVPRRVESPV
jgi:DNA repair exonuclease SbcCD ATPase subunit